MARSELPEGEVAFSDFPDNYRWSHGTLLPLGGIQWGGGEIDEIKRVGLRLRQRMGDDQAWFEEWTAEAERLEAIGDERAALGHRVSAASYLFRAAHYYHVGERFVQPKTERSQAAYGHGVAAFKRA